MFLLFSLVERTDINFRVVDPLRAFADQVSVITSTSKGESMRNKDDEVALRASEADLGWRL
jgi:hypothetical protein